MFEAYGSPLALPFDPSKGITPGGGKVFFVNETDGLDTHEGTDPQFQLKTINAAIAKCGQRKHDYIFVQDHHQEGATITINVRTIHLIGLGNGAPLSPRCLIDGETLNCIELPEEAGGVELAGFNLFSAGADCIVTTDVVWQAHIHHCIFAENMVGGGGIIAPGPHQLAHAMIDHNWFGRFLAGNKVDIVSSRCSINHNIFRVWAGIGIFGRDGDMGTILGNVFFSPIAEALVAGWAVDLSAGIDGALVVGNKASANGQAGTTNPYIDRSSGAVATLLNGWADNFDGPALSAGPDTA